MTQQVEAGKPADLMKRFPRAKSDRRLRAEFLERLLTSHLQDIKARRHGFEIVGAVVVGPLDLDTAVVYYDVNLLQCEFTDDVVGSSAMFKRSVVFDGSEMRALRFTDARIAGNVHLNDVKFQESVDFRYAVVGGNLNAERAEFLNPKEEATFAALKVTGHSIFRQAQFRGPVSFLRMTVGGNLDLHGAHFFHAEDRGGGEDVTPNVNCKGLRVGDAFFLDQVQFDGHVDFEYADIAGKVEAGNARFLDDKDRGGGKGGPNPNVNFRGLKARAAFFNGAEFRGRVYFRDANIQSLYFLRQVKWPAQRGSVVLDGLTYQYLSAGHGEEHFQELLRLADRAVFSAGVYAALERFFEGQGRKDWANEVFVAQKRRERVENLRGLDWLFSYLLDIIVRHGRKPGRALLWSVLFVLVGTLVFLREEDMDMVSSAEEHPATYSAFWYSLDQLLPIVGLYAKDAWQPKPHRRLAWLYLRLHVIIGWILIPVGLAAVTGNIH